MDAEGVWKELEAAAPAGRGVVRRRVLPESPRNLFLGIAQPSGRRLLILSVPAEALAGVRELPSTRAVQTTAVVISDEAIELRVELEAAEAQRVFTPFVEDVASAAANATDDADAVRALLARFGHWRRLLTSELAEGLSAEAAQGLWGELWVMRHLLHALWADGVVRAWTGPEHDDNDFRQGQVAVEVKTLRSDLPSLVRISGERQLDPAPGSRLVLLVLALDRHHQGAGESLPEMVNGCRDLLGGGSLIEFEDRLLASGYSEAHRLRYEDTRYTVRSRTSYDVREGFPRIVEHDLRAGVGRVTYHVALDACAAFEIDPASLDARLTGD